MNDLVIFRDCHASHNIVWSDCTPQDEQWIRRYAQKRGWIVCERRKPQINLMLGKLHEKDQEIKRLEKEIASQRRYTRLYAEAGQELLEKTEGGAK